MKDHREAVRAWFLANAYIPDEQYSCNAYPDDRENLAFNNHIASCELRWAKEPNPGTVKAFDGHRAPERRIPGVRAEVYCACDEYEDWQPVTLFIPGKRDLWEIFAAVDTTEGS